MSDRLSTPQRILVVRALPGLGDLLCAVPAFRALRAAFPQSEITWLGLPETRSFVSSFAQPPSRFGRYIDRFLEFPGFPGIPEVAIDPVGISQFLVQMQHQFDLALQLHGNGSVMNTFVALLGAKQTAGFYLPGRFCPNSDRFLPYPDDEPEVCRSLRLLEFLGVPLQGEQLEFPVTAVDEQAFVALNLWLDRYICIHPGASVTARRWSIERFAKLADALAARGFQIVLTGTATEAPLIQSVMAAMRYPAIDLAGKTDLGALAVLLKRSRLLVCNDTGVSHLAAALAVPSVVIFSDSDLHRWRPLDRQLHRAIDTRLEDDTLNRAIEQAVDLLQREYAHAG